MSRRSYAQHMFRIGLPMNDPIIELAATWAAGNTASSKLIREAMRSAELWRADKDKLRRRAAASLHAKLVKYLEYAIKAEERGSAHKVFKPGSLVTGHQASTGTYTRRNPSVERTLERLQDVNEISPRKGEEAARKLGYRSYRSAVTALFKKLHAEVASEGRRRNPRVRFRTCKGKKVSFKAKRRRKGRTPKHLRKHLFKKGHRPWNRC